MEPWLRLASNLQRQVDDVIVGHTEHLLHQDDRLLEPVRDHNQVETSVDFLNRLSEKRKLLSLSL